VIWEAVVAPVYRNSISTLHLKQRCIIPFVIKGIMRSVISDLQRYLSEGYLRGLFRDTSASEFGPLFFSKAPLSSVTVY